jgi:hypothetical protein
MTMTRRRFAILFHENATEGTLKNYLITRLADHWREDGHDVIFLFGLSDFVPADLVIVHVDLSVVPDRYLEFARRYPVAINGRVKDIRKSTVSKNLVQQGDSYDGRVIVKSNLNHAGVPERSLAVNGPGPLSLASRLLDRYRRARSAKFGSPLDYHIYENPQQVPRRYFQQKDLIVEKFLPEIDNGLYCIRNFYFLGDRTACIRRKGRHPIVNGSTYIEVERVDPHPEIIAMRETLGFDYGKFDYVVIDGRAVLLDVNKTIGWPRGPDTPEAQAMRRERAQGIYDYLR